MNNLAGLMDRRIRLEVKATGKQANGENAKGWQSHWTGWGGKKDESFMSENEDGKQIVATGRTSWTIRYQSGITPLMRLIDQTNPDDEIIYNIKGVSEVGRREALKLTCERVNV